MTTTPAVFLRWTVAWMPNRNPGVLHLLMQEQDADGSWRTIRWAPIIQESGVEFMDAVATTQAALTDAERSYRHLMAQVAQARAVSGR